MDNTSSARSECGSMSAAGIPCRRSCTYVEARRFDFPWPVRPMTCLCWDMSPALRTSGLRHHQGPWCPRTIAGSVLADIRSRCPSDKGPTLGFAGDHPGRIAEQTRGGALGRVARRVGEAQPGVEGPHEEVAGPGLLAGLLEPVGRPGEQVPRPGPVVDGAD